MDSTFKASRLPGSSGIAAPGVPAAPACLTYQPCGAQIAARYAAIEQLDVSETKVTRAEVDKALGGRDEYLECVCPCAAAAP